MRVCSRIYFFLCAIWSGAWPILNARRLTLWSRSKKTLKKSLISCSGASYFATVRQMFAKIRQMFAKCSPNVRQMSPNVRQMSPNVFQNLSISVPKTHKMLKSLLVAKRVAVRDGGLYSTSFCREFRRGAFLFSKNLHFFSQILQMSHFFVNFHQILLNFSKCLQILSNFHQI